MAYDFDHDRYYSPKYVLCMMYNHMRSRNKVDFSLEQFYSMYLDDKRYLRLHAEWVKSNRPKRLKPSLDRIDRNKHYSVDNIQMLTWEENRYKQNMERRHRKGPVIQLLDGKEVARFKSQLDARRKTGIHNISAVLRGVRKQAAGYQFTYGVSDE